MCRPPGVSSSRSSGSRGGARRGLSFASPPERSRRFFERLRVCSAASSAIQGGRGPIGWMGSIVCACGHTVRRCVRRHAHQTWVRGYAQTWQALRPADRAWPGAARQPACAARGRWRRPTPLHNTRPLPPARAGRRPRAFAWAVTNSRRSGSRRDRPTPSPARRCEPRGDARRGPAPSPCAATGVAGALSARALLALAGLDGLVALTGHDDHRSGPWGCDACRCGAAVGVCLQRPLPPPLSRPRRRSARWQSKMKCTKRRCSPSPISSKQIARRP